MDPFVAKMLERKTAFHNAVKQKFCKNSICTLVDIPDTEDKIDPADKYNVDVTGCPNIRRNGSAFCQDCSDAHKKNGTEIPKE